MSGKSHKPQGPFQPEMNSALSAAFGDISGISATFGADSKTSAIGAEAYSHDNDIALGSHLSDDMSDPHSLEVIGHEVAHALGGGGSGQSLVDQPGDPGEASADHAGAAFRDFVIGGGPAPSLGAAVGGQAEYHRWESGEHMHAVDDAAKAGSNEGAHVSAGAAEQLNTRIEMNNGMSLSPGELTALMGDYYGVINPDTHELDIEASMQQLQDAPADEMQRLVNGIRHEYDHPDEHMATEEAEWITRRREEHGSYLEMAQMNDSHFSSASEDGTDNNMGTYTALHAQALEAAQNGDANTARMYEAMSMHYLTDRHSAGHGFDKQEAMNHSGWDKEDDGSDGTIRNLYAKLAHDELNENGAMMHSADGSEFMAYGDGHWADDRNVQNRRQTHNSVGTSYDELSQVLAGSSSAEQIGDQGYGASQSVPLYDRTIQERANKTVDDGNLWDIATDYYDAAPGTALGVAERWFGQSVEPKWDAATDWVGGAWDTVTDGAVGAWDATTDWVGGAWDTGTDAAVDAWDTSTDWVGGAWDTSTDAVVGAWDSTTDWAGDTWDTGTDAVVGAWDSTTSAVGGAWDSSTDAVSGAWDSGTDAVASFFSGW